MKSMQSDTTKRLTQVIFFLASFLLVVGLFLALAFPASAQVGTATPAAMGTVSGTMMPTAMGTVSGTMMATSPAMMATATSMPAAVGTAVVPVTGGTTVPTVAAPAAGLGTPTALVPVTGEDLNQAQDSVAAQQRLFLDGGIVLVGLGLLIVGLIIRARK